MDEPGVGTTPRWVSVLGAVVVLAVSVPTLMLILVAAFDH
jgi:hypothetical protein